MEADMKILLVILTSFISLAILLIAGLQLIRLLLNEFAEIASEAWRSPEIESNH